MVGFDPGAPMTVETTYKSHSSCQVSRRQSSVAWHRGADQWTCQCQLSNRPTSCTKGGAGPGPRDVGLGGGLGPRKGPTQCQCHQRCQCQWRHGSCAGRGSLTGYAAQGLEPRPGEDGAGGTSPRLPGPLTLTTDRDPQPGPQAATASQAGSGTKTVGWLVPHHHCQPEWLWQAMRPILMVVGLYACIMLPSAEAQVPAIQRSALVDLYTSTNGTAWKNSANWLTGDPCLNSWSGVGCTTGMEIGCVDHRIFRFHCSSVVTSLMLQARWPLGDTSS
jgi:hypothetical protein